MLMSSPSHPAVPVDQCNGEEEGKKTWLRTEKAAPALKIQLADPSCNRSETSATLKTRQLSRVLEGRARRLIKNKSSVDKTEKNVKGVGILSNTTEGKDFNRAYTHHLHLNAKEKSFQFNQEKSPNHRF